MIKVDKIAESSFFSQKNIAGRGFGFGFASCGSALKFYLMPKRSKLLSKIFNSKIIYSKKVIEDGEYHKKCGVCSCDTFFNHHRNEGSGFGLGSCGNASGNSTTDHEIN